MSLVLVERAVFYKWLAIDSQRAAGKKTGYCERAVIGAPRPNVAPSSYGDHAGRHPGQQFAASRDLNTVVNANIDKSEHLLAGL